MANSVKISDLEYGDYKQLSSLDELVLVSINNSTKRTIKTKLSDITEYELNNTSIGSSIKSISSDLSNNIEHTNNNISSISTIFKNIDFLSNEISGISEAGSGSSSEIKNELKKISTSLSTEISTNRDNIEKVSDGISSVGVIEELCNNISTYNAINLSANAVSSYVIKGGMFTQVPESSPAIYNVKYNIKEDSFITMHITANIRPETTYLSVFILSSETAQPADKYSVFRINDYNTPQCILSMPFKAGTVIAVYTSTKTDADRNDTNIIQIDSYKLHISKMTDPKTIMEISVDLDNLSSDVYTEISSNLNSLSSDVYTEISSNLSSLSSDVYDEISSNLSSLSTDVYDEISSNISNLSSFMSCLINDDAKKTLSTYTETGKDFAGKTLTEIVITLYGLICEISCEISSYVSANNQ